MPVEIKEGLSFLWIPGIGSTPILARNPAPGQDLMDGCSWMFSYASLEQRVPADHPMRAVRRLADKVLRSLSPEFDALHADSGRPSIAPEYILRAQLLQVFYSVRSERLLVEQIDYNLRFID